MPQPEELRTVEERGVAATEAAQKVSDILTDEKFNKEAEVR
eukprot:CAMPEP_0177603248 /NCGR_PEP_ID=MMETSP0419_2-20121207/15395_1 /TAXON_ID=582737 /ORGANISM="Tetraselmis sp., Strain GSL018" /LENGTH=40 /DNA_ID= /DNA_START= /DNA_END= /DNA_ORIENTATION=